MTLSAKFIAASRMSKYSSQDDYSDEATGVLKNRFGIAGQAALDELEAGLVFTRATELSERLIPGQFDLAHLQAIHRHLFGDIYDWARQLRHGDISKGDSRFAHHAYIGSEAAKLFEKLVHEHNLKDLDPTAALDRAREMHVDPGRHVCV